MPTNLISELETPCRWFGMGKCCVEGVLYDASTKQMATLEGSPVFCPACGGNGHILSKAGEQLVEMIWRRLQRKVFEIVTKVQG
jgi:hypothetical protein